MLDKPLFVDNQLINITGSMGLAYAPQHGSDPQTLMKYAGLALHKAKANGKHQVQVFTEALTAEASYKLFVESNLRRALAQNELAVHYQPKLCLRSGALLGLEALLRWQHPEKGMIRPDRFISVAEETGLIVPIGKWVIREACRQARELAEAGLGELQMAINLSPKQFTDPDLVGSIAAILHEESIPASQLELELTESLLLDATDDTRQQLERLKSLGLTLAMDDFGTGYSSLSYLKKFPIDVIKIDRSFIKDIPDNQDDMEITSAVIAMAHNLKLKVVAEGVETAEQLAFLRRNRCDIGQGYLFDRPIPSDLLTTSLLRYPCRPALNDSGAACPQPFARAVSNLPQSKTNAVIFGEYPSLLPPLFEQETNAMVLRSQILAQKLELPTPAQALPGRESAMPVPEAHFVNGRPLTAPFPAGLQQVLFGLGCFWGAERRLWQQPGVWVTAVGYAGGFTPNPTYDEVCSGLTGHSEVVLVVYDPQETSFEQLLKVFWEAHDPTQGMRQGGDIGTQYRSVIYTFDAAQKAAALASREAFQAELSAKPATAASPPRSPTSRPSTTPRPTTSSTWRRTPTATAAWAARASACRRKPYLQERAPSAISTAPAPDHRDRARITKKPRHCQGFFHSATSQSTCLPPWLWAMTSASQGSRSRSSSSSGHGGLTMASPEPLKRSASSIGCTCSSARSSFGATLRSRAW